MKTKKSNGSALDSLIADLKKPKVPKAPVLGISLEDVKKARIAHKLGGKIGSIAKALAVSYPTAWKAVKGIAPYDQVK